jgi:NAD(P) transhydrogenase subunit alpha
VDLAAERGGNVELTQADKVVEHNGVRLVGYTNLQGRIPTTASQLYARNLLAFVSTLIDARSKALALNWDDELVKAVTLTRDGQVVHPGLAAILAPTEASPEAASEVPPPKPLRKATARKAQVPAMADTPKKAAPGVEQSVPAAAGPQPTPAKRAATKKATAVINAAAAAAKGNIAKPVASPLEVNPVPRTRTRRVITTIVPPSAENADPVDPISTTPTNPKDSE